MNIVLLEDEMAAGQALKEILNAKGFNCIHFGTAEEVLMHPKEDVDIFILDYHINGKPEGGRVAKELRQKGYKLPIIMLTSEHDEKIVISCFDAEVDDYINKPVRCDELKARIDRHLAKSGKINRNHLKHNELILNPETKEVRLGARWVHLTPSEFKILQFMMQHRGTIICRQDIIDFVNDENIIVGRRTVDTHVNSLRKKIPENTLKITARRGFGYGIL